MSATTNKRPVAIITGASSGIGLGITQALLEHGYQVVGTSRIISESKALKASRDLVLVDGDISKKETAVTVAEMAINKLGRIDLQVSTRMLAFCARHSIAPVVEFLPISKITRGLSACARAKRIIGSCW